MSEEKRKRFTIVNNEESVTSDNCERRRKRACQTNPLKMQEQSLQEQFMQYTNKEAEKRFTVISNKERIISDNYEKQRKRASQTNPLKIQGQSLQEQFMQYTNEEAEKRFTVEDLLKFC